MLITEEYVLEKYPKILEKFNNKYVRNFELSESLGITRGEAVVILDVLQRAGHIENTTSGWRLRK